MRPLTVIGTILMVFAFVVLAVFIVIPAILPTIDSVPFIKNTLQAVLCKPGENLSAAYSEYDTPGTTSRSTDLSCGTDDENAYDVSGKGITIGFVGYIVPFLVGLFMTIAGSQQKQKARLARIQSNFVPSYTPGYSDSSQEVQTPNGYKISAEPDGEVTIVSPDGKSFTRRPRMATGDQGSATGHVPLAQHLTELKQALDEGLITQAEYDAKRKDLLNQM